MNALVAFATEYKWELMVGAIAIISGVLGYLKSVALWFRGFVVKTCWLDAKLADIVASFLIAHGKSRSTQPLLGTARWYVKPLNRSQLVAWQDLRENSLFWYRRRPCWISKIQKDINAVHPYKMSYVRGFAWDLMLKEAMDWCGEDHGSTSKELRHRIVYHHGKSLGDELARQKDDNERENKWTYIWGRANGKRLLHWDASEIGGRSISTTFASIALSPELDKVAEEVRHWRKSKKWYLERGVVWRRGFMFHGPPGTGKCLGIGTPILMHNGNIRRVEDIRVGDQVMGPDSQPRQVQGLGHGIAPLYRIIPVKGDTWVCNVDHMLTLQGTRLLTGQVIDVSVKEYLSWNDNQKSQWKLWRVAIDYPQATQAMPPYLIGLWLGDGTRAKPEVSTKDSEIANYMFEVAAQLGLHYTHRVDPRSGVITCGLVTSSLPGGNGIGSNPFRNETRRCLIRSDEKHIPSNYLVADRDQRLQLLAGLMDSDGHLTCNGYDYISKDKQLASDVTTLCRSLGFAAYLTPCVKGIKALDFSGLYYRVSISGTVSDIPCKLPRKRASIRQQIKRVTVTGFQLESIGDGEYFGFTLDGDGRFLLGDFTVTHNTTLARAIGEDVDMPIHVFDLASMSNNDLREAWAEMAADAPCVALIEDIDGVFVGRQNMASGSGGTMARAGLTFDALLNCIDGVERKDGVLLVVTSNHIDKIDPAMLRPGRIDRVVEFKPLDHVARLKVARQILGDDPAIAQLLGDTDVPAAQFVEKCCRKALDKLYGDEPKKDGVYR